MSDSSPQLKDRTALITGATSGIGLGIARALAVQGCHIGMNGSRPEQEIIPLCDEVADEFGVRCVPLSADMSDPQAIAAMVAAAEQALGPIDILINNAGIQHVAPIDTFPAEMWDRLIAINLSSVFHTSRAVLPGMKARGWGRIVNIASAHGLVASPFKSAYVAAKHGMVGFTKVTALETATEGITCNAICPGYVWTPLVEKQIPDQAKSHGMSEEEVIDQVILAPQPNRKFASVEEIGALAVFLCSAAGASITGASLPVDGGWTAR